MSVNPCIEASVSGFFITMIRRFKLHKISTFASHPITFLISNGRVAITWNKTYIFLQVKNRFSILLIKKYKLIFNLLLNNKKINLVLDLFLHI